MLQTQSPRISAGRPAHDNINTRPREHTPVRICLAPFSIWSQLECCRGLFFTRGRIFCRALAALGGRLGLAFPGSFPGSFCSLLQAREQKCGETRSCLRWLVHTHDSECSSTWWFACKSFLPVLMLVVLYGRQLASIFWFPRPIRQIHGDSLLTWTVMCGAYSGRVWTLRHLRAGLGGAHSGHLSWVACNARVLCFQGRKRLAQSSEPQAAPYPGVRI